MVHMKGSNSIKNISIGVGIAVFFAITGSQYFVHGEKPPVSVTSEQSAAGITEAGTSAISTALGSAEAGEISDVQATSTKFGVEFSLALGTSIVIPNADPKKDITIKFVSLDSFVERKAAMINVITPGGVQTYARLSVRDDYSAVAAWGVYTLRLLNLSIDGVPTAYLSLTSANATSTN